MKQLQMRFFSIFFLIFCSPVLLANSSIREIIKPGTTPCKISLAGLQDRDVIEVTNSVLIAWLGGKVTRLDIHSITGTEGRRLEVNEGGPILSDGWVRHWDRNGDATSEFLRKGKKKNGPAFEFVNDKKANRVVLASWTEFKDDQVIAKFLPIAPLASNSAGNDNVAPNGTPAFLFIEGGTKGMTYHWRPLGSSVDFQTIQYQNGKAEGAFRAYHPTTGNLLIEGQYQDGKASGVWITYNPVSYQHETTITFVEGVMMQFSNP